MSISILCPENHPVVIPVVRKGTLVFCPYCFTPFNAHPAHELARLARAEKGKSRPSRDDDDDDDDDDEEEEKPKKVKPQPVKKKPAREGKKPPVLKPTRKRDADDDDDADDEADVEAPEADEEEPIRWTSRKRQLQVVFNGLKLYQIGLWMLFASWIIDGISILFVLAGIFLPDFLFIAGILWVFLMGPLLGLSFLMQFIAWIMCLWAPSKAEVRGPVIAAIFFLAGPTLLYLVFFLLQMTNFFRNEEVENRFANMLMIGAGISLLICFFCSLQVLSKIAAFMRLPQLVKEPITLGWFIIGGTILRTLTLSFIVWWQLAMGYVFAYPYILPEIMYFFVLRSNRDLITVVIKLRESIYKYIRDV